MPFLGRKMFNDKKKQQLFQSAVADIAKTQMGIVTGAIRNLLKDSTEPKLGKYECWCYNCNKDKIVNGFPYTATRMILCPDCGNKRCPKATDHIYKCTNSNEPGQRGSRYQ
jgi:hypothetical protein